MQGTKTSSFRLPSIDILRGVIMVWMALDHTRDFFTDIRFEPETLAQTTVALFVTRWMTHFCAPMFFFLAGTGAFLYGQRRSPQELRKFLWTRGAWLIVVEFTLVGLAWTFQLPGGFFGVIWALGASMLALAMVIRLAVRLILAGSFAIIAGHNLLDRFRPQGFGSLAWLWGILHARGDILLPGHIPQYVLFPLIPLAAVMAAGYAFGQVYTFDRERRRRLMATVGLALTLAFLILRATNCYGHPPAGQGGVSQGDWHPQASLERTVILFFDVEKYPASLQFLLMTVGPSLLALAALDRDSVPPGASPLRIFGRVPMFFYVLHLYLIHWMAVLVAVITHQPARWLFHGAVFAETPPGYGHSLPFVYLMWFVVLLLLYVPCWWFEDLKRRRTDWWLSYL